MTLALVSDLSRNLLVRTFAATAVVFLVTALATGVLPVKCLMGAKSCAASGPVQVTTLIDEPAAPPSAEVPATMQKVATVSPISPTLTQNEVVDGSFAALTVGATTPAAAGDVPNADDDLTAPKVRSVKTVSIHADGTPDLGTSATPQTAVPLAAPPSAPETQLAMATPQVAPLIAPAANTDGDALGYVSTASKAPAPETAATRAADDIATGTAPQDATPVVTVAKVATTTTKKTTVPKPTTTGDHSGTLKGAGANVHADAKNSSRILFALPGGSKVTVLEQAHGWLHITDGKGRSGWVYKDYISA